MSIVNLVLKNRSWLVMAALMLLPGIAMASGADASMPYEAGLDLLVTSITGPVAFTISVIGVVAAGAMLIFGGDMNGFMRSMVFLILVIGLIISASAILKNFFSKNGAVVDAGSSLAESLYNLGVC